MTNEIIHNQTNQDIAEFIRGLNLKANTIQKYLECHYPIVLKCLFERTRFLDVPNKKYPITARIYCLQNNISEHPKCQCPDCTNNVDWCGKQKKFRKYCSNSCSLKSDETKIQRKKTMVARHGVEYYTQAKDFRTKSEETSIKHFGVKNPMQSSEVQSKFQKSMLENHGVRFSAQSKEIREKMKSTCKSRIGVDSPMQNPTILKKALQTQTNRYGGIGFQSKTIVEKFEETMQRNYNVNHPSQSQQILQKSKQTCIDRYGVDNYSKTPEFAKKSHMPYTNPKYPNMSWATSWEFKVYDFLTEHNIPFEYQPAIAIPYECEGTYHTYHPDFLVRDRVVEVKGDNFFRINEETGKEEMYLTWKGKLSDEEYEWKCKVMEAKHQCMIANNVIIIRGKDLSDLASIFLK